MPREINPRLNIPQAQFLAMPHKFRAFVAGFGSGKTWTGCASIAKFCLAHPRVMQGYYAPTFPHIRDIFFPTIEEVLFDWGMDCVIKQSDKEVDIYRGGKYRSTVICRSLDNPASIVGYKVGHSMIDELDILTEEKATLAWRKIIARMRYKIDGLRNGIDVTTTPEGFKFTYQQFKNKPSQKPELLTNYGILHASTYQNAKNLPDDYIPSLEEAYPQELISAYLNGQFVNLTSGTVYKQYDRVRNNSLESIQAGEDLYIGQDFNVTKMASTVYVKRWNGWHAVDELIDIYDTPALIKTIKERYAGHKITIYPDASGGSRKTVDASKSDIGELEHAGFIVRVNNKNPAVKDRIMSVNKQFQDCHLWVNALRCPTVARCLEQQAYDKNGEPEKSGNDHQNDATGYPIVYEFPIIKPIINTKIKMFG